MERPDQREFDFDPLAEVRANRAELLVAGLTILRAYKVAGAPVKLTPMGSFDDWAWVREALVWLGCADPAETREAIFADGPRKSELVDVMDAWEEALGTVAVVPSEIGAFEHNDGAPALELRRVLTEVACRGGPWNSRSVGWWLRRNADRVVAGRRISREGPRRWRLVGAEPSGADGQREIEF